MSGLEPWLNLTSTSSMDIFDPLAETLGKKSPRRRGNRISLCRFANMDYHPHPDDGVRGLDRRSDSIVTSVITTIVASVITSIITSTVASVITSIVASVITSIVASVITSTVVQVRCCARSPKQRSRPRREVVGADQTVAPPARAQEPSSGFAWTGARGGKHAGREAVETYCRREWIFRACGGWRVLGMIAQHVDQRVTNLPRRCELDPMPAIAEHRPATRKPTIDAEREPRGQAAHTRSERLRTACLDEEVHVIRLDGVMDDAETPLTVSSGDSAERTEHGGRHELTAQTTQPAT